jgi:hypothetical protein
MAKLGKERDFGTGRWNIFAERTRSTSVIYWNGASPGHGETTERLWWSGELLGWLPGRHDAKEYSEVDAQAEIDRHEIEKHLPRDWLE